MKTAIFLMFSVLSLVYSNDECDDKPLQLKSKEEYCWTEEVEVVDRIVQRSKDVFNFAKKKLGISVEEEDNEKQKCEYYMCILRQLNMLNANDYPAHESIKEWTKRHVTYFRAVSLIDQLDKCNGALANRTINEENFYASQIEQGSHDDGKSQTNNEQTTCEIASEFFKCLSLQKECPVFKFP